MIIKFKKLYNSADVDRVRDFLRDSGYSSVIRDNRDGETRTVLAVTGKYENADANRIREMDGVDGVIETGTPYRLTHRVFRDNPTIVKVGDIEIGGVHPVIIAGPCAVESEDQLLETAEFVRKQGAVMLRGGAFKPRTSPYSFQGLGEEGLKLLDKARRETGLYVVTEVLETADLELVAEYTDVLQIGSRNMHNSRLLKAVGKLDKPVLLKRGMSAQLHELLMAAEFILAEGNRNVILCERGIRTFADHSRNTLDLSVVPCIKRESHLPVIVDPSHGTGRRDLVGPMSLAALAAGADGLMIEVHPAPDDSLSDRSQTLGFESFDVLMRQAKGLIEWKLKGRNI